MLLFLLQAGAEFVKNRCCNVIYENAICTLDTKYEKVEQFVFLNGSFLVLETDGQRLKIYPG